jgi:hypothetical protein
MRSLLLITCVAAALVLPAAAASAMPVDNGPAPLHQRPASARALPAAPAVRTVTITRTSGDTFTLVLAGAALAVALGTAGFSVVRLRARPGIDREAPLAGAPV